MHATAVGQYQVGSLHGGYKVKIVQWCDQLNSGVSAQHGVGQFLHIGVGVNGVEHVHIGVLLQDLQHGVKDVLQRLAKVFAPVGGQQDEATCLLDGCRHLSHGLQQCVYTGVTDHMDFAGVYAFLPQGMGRTLSGCKVPLGNARDHLAIALLREWVL